MNAKLLALTATVKEVTDDTLGKCKIVALIQFPRGHSHYTGTLKIFHNYRLVSSTRVWYARNCRQSHCMQRVIVINGLNAPLYRHKYGLWTFCLNGKCVTVNYTKRVTVHREVSHMLTVSYRGAKLPFGNYVIWDSYRHIFKAFSTATQLNEALRKLGYMKDHHVIATGIFTPYGYFSNEELYDLYLKLRYPEVYSATARRIVMHHFTQYNRNPNAFRAKLLNNPTVIRELEQAHARAVEQVERFREQSVLRRYNITTVTPEVQKLAKRIAMLESEISAVRALAQSNYTFKGLLADLLKQYAMLTQELQRIAERQRIPVPTARAEHSIVAQIAKILPVLLPIAFLAFVFYIVIRLMGRIL